MLWIALFLPELPLQSVEARCFLGLDTASTPPHAISEGPDTRPVLCAVNAVARERGIRPGQTASMARALAADLIITPRQVKWEQAALESVATIACQFTPMTSLEQDSVLLEVSTSLKLFGGLGQLFSLLRSQLLASGYRAHAGIAPTPLAAWLLAKARSTRPGVRGTQNLDELPQRLADLPLALFNWPSSQLSTLAELGLTRIADLSNQPRAGLTRRFGATLVQDLDRALGRLPDPRKPFELPATFHAEAEFMREVSHFEGLRFPLRRLLDELGHFLHARGAATRRAVLRLEHGRTRHSEIILATQTPTRERERWERLLNERITREPLQGDVSALHLDCCEIVPFESQTLSWLPDTQVGSRKLGELIEQLSARLGPTAVHGIALRSDHRPELAWMRCDTPVRQRLLPAEDEPPPARPLWLLGTPRNLIARQELPHYHGPLSMLSGPERIETGWWDGQPARRDYFIARNSQGEVLWIYRELSQPGNWYLHGHFG
jgi:protein ImuB